MDKAIRGGREKEGIVRKEKDSYPTLNQAENRKESDEDDTMAGIRNKQGTGYLFFSSFCFLRCRIWRDIGWAVC